MLKKILLGRHFASAVNSEEEDGETIEFTFESSLAETEQLTAEATSKSEIDTKRTIAGEWTTTSEADAQSMTHAFEEEILAAAELYMATDDVKGQGLAGELDQIRTTTTAVTTGEKEVAATAGLMRMASWSGVAVSFGQDPVEETVSDTSAPGRIA